MKVTQTIGDQVRVSTASAIDLAGSEDNRRTENGKERMVESASINKSLFVLAQCVEAISKKQSRIPYRESKMTRILSLGQNDGLTVMILNLAPVRSYHLDTLSSLNFANRTKKIEINEVENKPFYRPGSKQEAPLVPSSQVSTMNRQPLRPKMLSHNVISKDPATKVEKPVKAFSVFADKDKPAVSRPGHLAGQGHPRVTAEPQKRSSSEAVATINRPSKLMRPSESMNKLARAAPSGMSQKSIEELIERKVSEKLAESALNMKLPANTGMDIPADVQARLDALERRIGDQESERAEGLQYLLMAKQHTVRKDDASALKMYQLALPFFPGNEKLVQKMLKLQDKIDRKAGRGRSTSAPGGVELPYDDRTEVEESHRKQETYDKEDDDEYQQESEAHEEDDDDEEGIPVSGYRSRARKPRRHLGVYRDEASKEQVEMARPGDRGTESEDELAYAMGNTQQTPRTKHILKVVNSRDVSQIRLLRGVGAKKAEMIVNCLCEMDEEAGHDQGEDGAMSGIIRDLSEFGRLKGVGAKGVERMRLAV